MKILVFKIFQSEDENGVVLSKVNLQWSEANEEITKKAAYNGEYTIEDVEVPEPEAKETTDDVLDALLGVM